MKVMVRALFEEDAIDFRSDATSKLSTPPSIVTENDHVRAKFIVTSLSGYRDESGSFGFNSVDGVLLLGFKDGE